MQPSVDKRASAAKARSIIATRESGTLSRAKLRRSMDPHRLAEERSLDNTRGATGWCLEPHDLVLSKLVAGREKHILFAEEAVRHRLVLVETLAERLRATPLSAELRALVEQRVQSLAALH